jgi:hypothetical protein
LLVSDGAEIFCLQPKVDGNSVLLGQFKLQAQRPAFLALRPKLGILVGDQNDRVRRSKICLERASDRRFIDRVIAGQRHDLESGLVEPAAKVCS